MLACTVATANRLPQARVLARSLTESNPGSELLVLIPDDPEASVGRHQPFTTLAPAAVGIDAEELGRRALIYGATELACSLKGPLLRHAVGLHGGPVAFLDADCLVYDDLAPLLDAARGTGLALTAHSLDPLPPGRDPVEALFQQHGAFNTGVLAATERGVPALDWWSELKARHCLHDVARGITADQSWIGLVPALFEYELVRDRGVNVMGWNLFQRDVDWSDGTPAIDGGPLRCFHFAGFFDPHEPDAFGPAPDRRDPWPPASALPGASRVCHDYAARLIEAGHDEHRDLPYGFERLPDGTRIGAVMREAYREALLAFEHGGGPEPPNPFLDSTVDAFLSWLASPGPRGVPRYLERIRARRLDLSQAFPAVPGSDAEALLRWAREAGTRGEIDVDWLR